MNFFIRQGATDPLLKLRLVDDGKNDKSLYNNLLEKSNSANKIKIEMFNVETNEYVMTNESCYLVFRTKKYDQTTEEYYIVYRFTEEQTSKKGRFEAIITIDLINLDLTTYGKLILPIKEKLYINII